MVDGAKSNKKYDITVQDNRLSGSHSYTGSKQFGIMADDMLRTGHQNLQEIIDWYDRNIEAIDRAKSSLAALGIMTPASFLPSAEHTYGPIRDTIKFLERLWVNTEVELTQADWMSSQAHAHNMIFWGNLGKLPFVPFMKGDDDVNTKLNGKLFTHNRSENIHDPKHGSLNEVDADDLRHYFTSDNPDDWPNLILTSSHALVRNHKDVSGVMKGFHALIADLFSEGDEKRKALPLIRRPDKREPNTNGDKRSIMVSAVHNDYNAWVNGGKLLMRLRHLDTMYNHSSSMSQAELEQAYLGDETKHTEMSPAAIRLAKTMLKLMVDEPDKIDPDSKQLTDPGTPIKLRSNVGHIMQHLKLVGYSKGGNIVTDAVRFLILELQHQTSKGTPSFEIPRMYVPKLPAGDTRDYIPITPESTDIIRGLMSNVGILCVNPGINPLSKRERDLGIRRITIRNKLDRISGHLFTSHEREGRFGEHDDVYVISGNTRGDLGHSIEGSLGTKEHPGYLIDEALVNKDDLPTLREVKSRLKSFFASCYGKVGISNIFYDNDQVGDEQSVRIEFSTGVSEDRVFNGDNSAYSHIQQAMEKNGLANISITCDLVGSRQCQIRFTVPEGENTAALLHKTFSTLEQIDPDIQVSDTTLRLLANQARQSPDLTIAATDIAETAIMSNGAGMARTGA